MFQSSQPNTTVRVGKDGKRMIFIPAGWFLMGTGQSDIEEMEQQFGWRQKWFADETPLHPVHLTSFYIDETPVTNAEYKRFLDANPRHRLPSGWSALSRKFPSGKEDHPVVNVAWGDAVEYAVWAGKRLPTEAEWEKAARSPTLDGETRRYPWGNAFDPARCNTTASRLNGTTPVTRYTRAGASPSGVFDMSGNVWEWCADWYDAQYYRKTPTHNPLGPSEGEWRVLRGGAWDLNPDYARCASRDYIVPDGSGYALVGFRCAESAE